MPARSSVRSLPVVGPIAARSIDRYRIWKADPGRRLARLLGRSATLSVVQIGASDGERQDPIRTLLLDHPAWTALLVEPFPPSFERLRANYPDESRFVLRNLAIAADEGARTFHYLDEAARSAVSGLPSHFDQLGSFFPDYLDSELGASRVAAIAPYRRTVDVPVRPLAAVLAEAGTARVDLFIVDTNGYDWEVLRQFDLTQHRPRVILFEHKHLSDEDITSARAFLRSDYRITDIGDDFLCVRNRTR